jgi:hypothetical protein
MNGDKTAAACALVASKPPGMMSTWGSRLKASEFPDPNRINELIKEMATGAKPRAKKKIVKYPVLMEHF